VSDFERGQIIGTRSAGASVTKAATILDVLGMTVSNFMSVYMNHENTTSAKRNGGRKSTMTERDCSTLRRTVLKNHKTPAV
jgi:hypothetical protein